MQWSVSDLSRLLDDVYGDSPVDDAQTPPSSPPPARAPLAGLPDWAVESVLDEAFADWVPGPPVVADAGATDELPYANGDLPYATDLAGTDEHTAGAIPRSAFSDVAAPAEVLPEAPHAWSREDDDILPTGRRRGGRKSRRGRPTALTSSAPIEAFAAPEEAAPEEAAPEKAKRSRLRRRKG